MMVPSVVYLLQVHKLLDSCKDRPGDSIHVEGYSHEYNASTTSGYRNVQTISNNNYYTELIDVDV